jgi:hypothetical protein
MRSSYEGKGHAFMISPRRRIALGATLLAVILIFFAVNNPAIVGASRRSGPCRFTASGATTRPCR